MNREQLDHFVFPNSAAYLAAQATITPVSSPGAEIQEVDDLNDFNEETWDNEDLDAMVISDEECTPDLSQEKTWYNNRLPCTSWTLNPEITAITWCARLTGVWILNTDMPDPVWLASGGKNNGPFSACIQSGRWVPRENWMLFDHETCKLIRIKPSRAQEFLGLPCKHGGGITALHYFRPIQPGDATDRMMSKAASRCFVTAHGNPLWQQVTSKVALSIGVPVYLQHPWECSWCACRGAIILGCGMVIDPPIHVASTYRNS
ncbi:uncharacterized protein VTP21DRAFT_6177 [Calcarisporiella thermophila]|uniref:uncharacterized protein n=1 Tax=Calcarisporiella thermophila TaxID=911321 RepID=UPI0037445196